MSHSNGQPGGAGTVYLRDTDLLQGTLLVDGRDGGAGWTPLGLPAQDTLTIPDAVVIRGANTHVRSEHVDLALDFQSTLTVEQQALLEMDQQLPVTLAGTLTIDGATLLAAGITAPEVSVINGGLLTSRTSTTTQMHKLELDVAGTVLVDATSRIDVSGKGYRPGYTTGNTTVGGATGNSGGSYGGLGGVYGGASNAVYGDYADPNDWGSGSGERVCVRSSWWRSGATECGDLGARWSPGGRWWEWRTIVVAPGVGSTCR